MEENRMKHTKLNSIEDIKAHIASRRMILAQHPGLVEEYTIEIIEAIQFWENELKELERSGTA